jgi:1,6-anhydro-N-acetylmuramate kinase
MSAIYIGVMTGTSMDGVDIVAASFDPLTLHATLTVPFDPELRDELMALTFLMTMKLIVWVKPMSLGTNDWTWH